MVEPEDALLALAPEARLQFFLVSTPWGANYAVFAVRSRERRRDEILRRMRRPSRGHVPGVWCPQCASSQVLRRVWRAPRVWRIVSSTPVARHVHAETPRGEDPHLQ